MKCPSPQDDNHMHETESRTGQSRSHKARRGDVDLLSKGLEIGILSGCRQAVYPPFVRTRPGITYKYLGTNIHLPTSNTHSQAQ